MTTQTVASGGPTRRRLGWPKRIVFSIATLALMTAVVEGLTYLGYWAIIGKPFSWAEVQEQRDSVQRLASQARSVVAQVHPYVGFVEEPRPDNGVMPFDSDEPVPVSSFGYFDDAPPLHRRSPDKVIVAITGGSVACYFAINGTEALEAELAQDPHFAGKRFEFVNLALGGYKQPQQLMTLSYLLSLGAEFDLVLNIDGFNEVGLYELENAGQNIFPAFPRSWHARVEVADPLMGRLMGKVEYLSEERLAKARAFSGFPWRYSVVSNVVWMLLDRRADWEIYSLKEGFWKSRPRLQRYVATGPPSEFGSTGELYEHLASIWENSSLQMDRLCRANGIRYVHVLQPNQYVAGSKPMGESEREIAVLKDHPYRHAAETGYPILIRRGEELRRRGVRYLDLTRAFADHPGPIYIDGCCHYNKEGYEILARAIAGAIRDDLGSTDAPAGH
jgi:hypothetical protein